MTEELEVRDEPIKTEFKNPFDESNWEETLPKQVMGVKAEEQLPIETIKEEPPVVSEWFKDLGFESADEAKNGVTELRKLKEVAPEDKKFANESSKKFYEMAAEGKEDELLDFLAQKKKLEKLTSSEVTENTAAEMVKLSMQQKYKDLTADEIDYKFNKMFGVPKEPVQTISEDDDEFEVRKQEWQEKVNEAKKELIIEAKLSKPELERIKNELKLELPDINKGEKQLATTPTQEDLDREQKLRTQYLESLEVANTTFNGFEVKYKNDAVEIPINFIPTEVEKKALKSELENFAVEDFILGRWFKEDGTPNATQLMEDVYLLRNKSSILQKVANETGTKVLDNYIQGKNLKNVSVTG